MKGFWTLKGRPFDCRDITLRGHLISETIKMRITRQLHSLVTERGPLEIRLNEEVTQGKPSVYFYLLLV